MEKQQDKKKILIVDDEMDMKIFLSTLVKTNGYEPVVSKDGKDGFEKARSIKPDLIILDVMMPGEGGVQMYRKLKDDAELKHIPVIVLSAISWKTYSHYLKMLNVTLGDAVYGVDAYFEKPPEAEDLLKSIEKMLCSSPPAGKEQR